MTAHTPPPSTDVPRQRLGLRIAVGGATLLVLCLHSAAVSVKERHTALVTRFGELVRVVDEPGLHWKLPWPIEAQVLVDRRLSVLSASQSEPLTADRRNIVVDAFAAWRVVDAPLFHRSLGTPERARQVLSEIVGSKLRAAIGRQPLSALVSTVEGELGAGEIEDAILVAVREETLATYGIEVESVGIKRLAFPEANIAAVFEQMRAERKKEADEARAKGQAEADRIEATTDQEVRTLVAEALRDAQVIRGEAETEIAALLATVKDLDPDLFEMMVKLNALEDLVGSNTAIYLSTAQEPFDLFNAASPSQEE